MSPITNTDDNANAQRFSGFAALYNQHCPPPPFWII